MDFTNLSLPLLLTRVLYTLAHSSCRLKEVKVSRYYLGLSGGVLWYSLLWLWLWPWCKWCGRERLGLPHWSRPSYLLAAGCQLRWWPMEAQTGVRLSGWSPIHGWEWEIPDTISPLLCWNLQLSWSFCFSHTSRPQWEIEQSHSSLTRRSAKPDQVSRVDHTYGLTGISSAHSRSDILYY